MVQHNDTQDYIMYKYTTVSDDCMANITLNRTINGQYMGCELLSSVAVITIAFHEVTDAAL